MVQNPPRVDGVSEQWERVLRDKYRVGKSADIACCVLCFFITGCAAAVIYVSVNMPESSARYVVQVGCGIVILCTFVCTAWVCIHIRNTRLRNRAIMIHELQIMIEFETLLSDTHTAAPPPAASAAPKHSAPVAGLPVLVQKKAFGVFANNRHSAPSPKNHIVRLINEDKAPGTGHLPMGTRQQTEAQTIKNCRP